MSEINKSYIKTKKYKYNCIVCGSECESFHTKSKYCKKCSSNINRERSKNKGTYIKKPVGYYSSTKLTTKCPKCGATLKRGFGTRVIWCPVIGCDYVTRG